MREQLPGWADLVLGYKQRGSEAEQAVNVYYPLTYEVPHNIATMTPEERKSVISQMNYFGQCPRQLLKIPHVKPLILYTPKVLGFPAQILF